MTRTELSRKVARERQNARVKNTRRRQGLEPYELARTKLEGLLTAQIGKPVIVEFVKKNGETRKMVGIYNPDGSTAVQERLPYLNFVDVALTGYTGKPQYRNVNLATVKRVCVGPREYRVI
ncbi:hypothetical protein [Desulfovibrio oxyclinae]|uniref:hypothetical protein n=1 Tax=Desulfovibrio oxyclinae TaxID=63560 RepID=UPI00037F9611|nr:hypothetical protein [Desulfovibrio oxyclinae]